MTENLQELDQYKRDIEKDGDAQADQRSSATEDMRFIHVTGGMWEGWLTDNDSVAKRVKMELDVVSNPLQRFIGEWNQNRVGVEFKPTDASTSDDDAKLINGIYRADFRRFSGKMSTDLAVDECATCGYGAFKLATAFDDEEDAENENQHIEWRPIYNAYSRVYWDSAAERIDKRDAQRCTVLDQYTPESFERVWPGRNPVSAYTPDTYQYRAFYSSPTEYVYIATRYEVRKIKEKRFVYNDLQRGKVVSFSKDEHEEALPEIRKNPLMMKVRERTVTRQIVEKTVFSGDEILEPKRRIVGKYIPIVPFYAYRAYVDGTEWYRGLVRKMKDPQRLYNMQISQLAENSASAGQDVPIFLADQMENEDISNAWADKNNKPYLVVEPAYDNDDKLIAAGPVGYNKPQQLDQSTTTLLGIVPAHIKDQTSSQNQEAFDSDMSGKAIKALIKREDMTTQVINDNIANAIAWSGEIYQAMAAEIYTTRRMVKTISKDGVEGDELLMKPTFDEEQGLMIETNDLRGKKFDTYADVGPQYETLKEETVENMKGLIEVLSSTDAGGPFLAPSLSILMDNVTGTGMEPLKKLNRRLMLAQGLIEPETDEEKQLVAQMQQQQQQPNAQQKAIDAFSENQLAEARNRDSDSVDNIASARKKEAETRKILAEIPREDDKLLLEAQRTAAMGLKQ